MKTRQQVKCLSCVWGKIFLKRRTLTKQIILESRIFLEAENIKLRKHMEEGGEEEGRRNVSMALKTDSTVSQFTNNFSLQIRTIRSESLCFMENFGL